MVSRLETPSCPPKTFAPLRHPTGSFLPLSTPTPSSKAGLWDVPPSPLQGAELCHPPDRHPPPKPPLSSSSPAPPQPLPVPGQTHLQSHRGPPPHPARPPARPRKRGGGGARSLARADSSGARLTRRRRRRRRRRQRLSQRAGGAAFAGNGGSRASGRTRGARDGERKAGCAGMHCRRQTDLHTRRAARETPAGRGREAVCGPPPSLLNTHPEVVLRLVLPGTPVPPRPPSSSPPPSLNEESFRGEGGRAGNEKGGEGREIAKGGW